MINYLQQVGGSLSCVLNALAGGPRVCTFSAWSWQLRLQGARWGDLRVALVDKLPGNGAGHCESAWVSHQQRGLIKAAARG